MNIKPKYVLYDICRMKPFNLIEYTHVNDVNTQVLEVSVINNGEQIELSSDYTYTAAIVNRETKALINNSIECSLNCSGNVEIPVDNFHQLGAQDLLIELTITDSNGNQVLVTPFPLWIHVNASILDDAQVTPDSLGTIPELLEEAKEALEATKDYETLENKPQINGHELTGNKSSDALDLQKKLIPGNNITLNENGLISASGGLTIDRTPPQIFSTEQYPYTEGDLFLYNQKLYEFIGTMPGTYHTRNIFSKTGRRIVYSSYEPPRFEETSAVSSFDTGDLYVVVTSQASNSQGRLIGQDVYLCVETIWLSNGSNYNMQYYYYWQKIRVEDISNIVTAAAVNQNGTITITLSDGTTVTSTGAVIESTSNKVTTIDANSTNAEYPSAKAVYDAIQGISYTLTLQDKQDIADIVIQMMNSAT